MKNTKIISPFKSPSHQHQDCLSNAINAAKSQCEASGQRFTKLRQRVLELVWQNHEPVKAYDLLESMKEDDMSSAPPTVYRALEFLQEQGLVHRIESLNAYVGCGDPSDKHSSQFFICSHCGLAAEINDDDIQSILTENAKSLGFRIDEQTIELKGKCQACLSK